MDGLILNCSRDCVALLVEVTLEIFNKAEVCKRVL